MGSLELLDDIDKSCHILYTNSGKAELYIHDKLQKLCGTKAFAVRSKTGDVEGFSRMLILVNMLPFDGIKWFFEIEYNKVKALVKQHKGIFEAETSLFLIKVDNFKEYSECVSLFPSANAMYLSYVNRQNMNYITKDFNISDSIRNYLSRNYSRDLEKIFILKEFLDGGGEVHSEKDVLKVCGEGSTSTTTFVYSVIKDQPKNQKSLSILLKNRVRMLYNIILQRGAAYAYNIVVSTLKDFLDLKVLYLMGNIYDTVEKLPEQYDEKKLSRYLFYLRKIEYDLDYNSIVNAYLFFKGENTWHSMDDAVASLYRYYIQLGFEEVNK